MSRTPVDQITVALAVAGRVAFSALQEPERRAAVRHLASVGMSPGGMADRLRTSTRQLQPYLPRRTAEEMTESESAARVLVYARADNGCERCGSQPGETWSHRVPQGQGGPWSASNGLYLCGDGTRGCHGWVEHHAREARKHGWRLTSKQKPELVPALIYHGGVLVRALLHDDGSIAVQHEGVAWPLDSRSTSAPSRSRRVR